MEYTSQGCKNNQNTNVNWKNPSKSVWFILCPFGQNHSNLYHVFSLPLPPNNFTQIFPCFIKQIGFNFQGKWIFHNCFVLKIVLLKFIKNFRGKCALAVYVLRKDILRSASRLPRKIRISHRQNAVIRILWLTLRLAFQMWTCNLRAEVTGIKKWV